MNNSTIRWYVLVVALVIGVLASMSVALPARHTIKFSTDGRIDFKSESRYWQDRIEDVGSFNSYAEFADAVANLTPREQHIAAHIFGETLYKVTSLREGVSVCDARFTMGCYHALFGAAAVEIGTVSFIEEMQTVCSDQSQGMERLCLHGVGHGILGSLGYDVKSMLRALDFCTQIPDGGNITVGCWGGVFMEYNVQSLISLDSLERPLRDDNMYEPCSKLPDKYMASCMFWQPTWWQIALSRHMDDDAVFRKMSSMCGDYSETSRAEACFKGIGFRATWTTGYNASAVAHACSLGGTVRGRLLCWHQAVSDLSRVEVQSAAPEVCSRLGAGDSAECLSLL